MIIWWITFYLLKKNSFDLLIGSFILIFWNSFDLLIPILILSYFWWIKGLIFNFIVTTLNNVLLKNSLLQQEIKTLDPQKCPRGVCGLVIGKFRFWYAFRFRFQYHFIFRLWPKFWFKIEPKTKTCWRTKITNLVPKKK